MDMEELNKKCDDKFVDLTFNDNGKLKGFKQYCRAKDFRRNKK